MEQLRAESASTLWRAVDETLDRTVRVSVLAPDLPHTADVLDSARRVALVQDSRLAKVLDVGDEGHVAFVVMENLTGRTLTQAVAGTPLPANEARRLVGEVAQALSAAAARGLHHQRLIPESLVIGDDGSVKITGTAIEAAETGAGSSNSVLASREDARGLICLLYAALTGRWPGTILSGLPGAPQVGGHPVPPSDLVAGVPNDLDELCAATLGAGGDVPGGPAEVAQRLAPWENVQPLTDPTGLLIPGTVDPSSSPAPGPTAGTTTPGWSWTTPAPATPPGATPLPAGHSPGPAAPGRQQRGHGPRQEPTPVSDGGQPEQNLRTEQLPPRRPTARIGKNDVSAVPRGSFRGWDDLSTIGTPVIDEEEPLVPFVPTATPQKPPGEQSRFVIAVVVSFVVLVVIIATLSLHSMKAPTELIPDIPTGTVPTGAATAVSGAASPAAASPTTSTPSASPTASPQIAGVQVIDPQGDGSENNDRAIQAIDGNTSTRWQSNHYNSAAFGGLKHGLGLVLDLGAGGSTLVHQVVLDATGNGGAVELRSSPGPGLDGSVVVAKAPIENNHAVLTPATPVDSRLLLLWFTTLPQINGKYQLLVSEINVR